MGEITVASTTDTQKTINDVAGIANEPQEEVKPQPEQEEAKEQPKADEKVQTEPEKLSKSAYQKRFDKLNRKIAELEAKLEPKEQAEVEAQPEPPQSQKAKPVPADFPNSYEDYIEALTDWKAEQRELRKAEEQARSAEDARLKEVFQSFANQMTDARSKYEDFDEALSASVPIYTGVELQILELENGAEVAYYLGKHRDVAQKLMAMSEVRAMAEVGKIAARLENVTQVDDTPTSEQEEPEEKTVDRASPPPRRAVSNAPPPITPVGGSSTKSSVPLDDLPYSEYRRIRDQQVKNKYRR